MGWKKDSKGNWVWNSSPSSWRTGYSSGKLIDTTSYYTSSSYNSRYYGSSWWSYGELSEDEKFEKLIGRNSVMEDNIMNIVHYSILMELKISINNKQEINI